MIPFEPNSQDYMQIQKSLVINADQEWLRCLLLKVISPTTNLIPVLAKSLTNIWKTRENFQIFVDINNIYKVHFDSVKDLENVLDNTPWKLQKKNLITLERVMPDTNMESYKFDQADFWIQFYRVPTNILNISYNPELASKIGNVHPIPSHIVKDWGTFARAKVSIKVTEQLKRSITGKLDHGITYQITIKVWENA